MQAILANFGSAVFGLASDLKSFDVYPNEPSRFHPYRNFSAALSQCGASAQAAWRLPLFWDVLSMSEAYDKKYVP